MSGSLTQGSVIPPQPTAADTQVQYPEWYQDLLYNIDNAANNLASQPYTQFPGPQIAEPSTGTQAAQGLVYNNLGNYKGALSRADQNTANASVPLTSSVIGGYADPYYSTLKDAGTGVTGALGYVGGNLGQDYTGSLNQEAGTAGQSFTDLLNQSASRGGQAYTGLLNQGALSSAGDYTSALANNSLPIGQAYTGALNQATEGAIPSYLDPYLDKVVGGLQSTLNTNLFQNTLPAIQDKFVSAGQTRSPQEAQLTSEAIYANQQALGQAVGPALSHAYDTALGAAQSAAGTGFRSGDQFSTSGLSAGTGAANTGLNAGIGTANTGLSTGANTAYTGLSSGLGAANSGFGYGSTGYGLGTSTAQDQQRMQQTTGAQFGQLGALTQQLGGYDVGQLAAAGQATDTNNQANVNAAINNFNAQQQWPYQNEAFASNITRGQSVPSNTYTVGLSPSAANSYTASPLASFVGTTLGGAALNNGLSTATANSLNSTQQLRKGGRVKPSNDNRKGALSMYRGAA